MKSALRVFLLILIIIPSFMAYSQSGGRVKSESIMAVYIFNFTKFLEWSNNDSDVFYISVLGKSRITESLFKVAENEKVKGKRIVIDELQDINNLKNNSVLFITGADADRLPAILKYASGKNVLTVGNTEKYAEKGVCINFFLSEDKIKFEINLKSIEKAGIIPNTRLLSIASRIYE